MSGWMVARRSWLSELGGVYWSGGASGLGSGRLLARYFARMLEVYCGQNRKTRSIFKLFSKASLGGSRNERQDRDPSRLKPYRSSNQGWNLQASRSINTSRELQEEHQWRSAVDIDPLGRCSKPDGAAMQAAGRSGTTRLHFRWKTGAGATGWSRPEMQVMHITWRNSKCDAWTFRRYGGRCTPKTNFYIIKIKKKV